MKNGNGSSSSNSTRKQQQQRYQRAIGARTHPLYCMLGVSLCVTFLFVVIIVSMGIVRAVATANDEPSPSHHNHHHKRKVATYTDAAQHERQQLLATGNVELNTLEALENVVDQHSVDESGWLPRTRSNSMSKRSTLAVVDPFSERAAQSAAQIAFPHGARSPHTVDLRGPHVRQVSHDTYYLGTNAHPHQPGVELHAFAFVHYAHEAGDPDAALKPKHMRRIEHSAKHKHFNRTEERATLVSYHDDHGSTSSKKEKRQEVIKCGAPISRGARWKTSKGYYLHPMNSGGSMSSAKIIEQAESAMDSWRCVFNELHMEPVGPLLGVVFDDDMEENGIDFQKPTGDNRIAFGRLYLADGEDDKTLAITITHGVFGGPVNARYIAEFSTVFNDAYTFADCAEVDANCKRQGFIDFQSIATHELGHALGLDDLYSEDCRDETMYWSALPGEINKRTLETQDKLSMKAVYLENYN